MRKWTKDILISILLVDITVLCIVRWQAWFGMPDEPYWAYDTIDYTFPYPEDVQDSSLTIIVLGDVHNGLLCADYDTLAARVPDANIVAQAGDWLDRGQTYYYQSLLREWTNSRLYGLPVLVTPGNHEYSKGLHKSLSSVWENGFKHPENGPSGVPGASYYVDLQGIRFITIDTTPLRHLVYLTRTLTWLRHAMNTAGERYIVVMMHHPVISAGKGRFNPLVYATFRRALGEADLVISGHDHSYMRHTPFVVLNSAGKVKKQRHNLNAAVADTVPVYGVLKVEKSGINIKEPEMRFTVHRFSDGTVIDSLYVKHD